jgi:hypothetical protein
VLHFRRTIPALLASIVAIDGRNDAQFIFGNKISYTFEIGFTWSIYKGSKSVLYVSRCSSFYSSENQVFFTLTLK